MKALEVLDGVRVSPVDLIALVKQSAGTAGCLNAQRSALVMAVKA